MLWLIPIGVGAVAVTALSRRAAAAVPPGTVHDPDAPTQRPEVADPHPMQRADVRALALAAGAPSDWADFFMLTAYGESRFNPNVGLGIRYGAPTWCEMNISEADAKASCKTYAKNKSWLEPCWPAAAYCWGSGGLFQLFPASALAAFRDDAWHRCAHPWSITDPAASMVYAAWYARRLQGWSTWGSSVISTRQGWASPSSMGKPAPDAKREKWSKHCQAVGLPPSFLDRPLARWRPAPAVEIWNALGVDDGWMPDVKAA